MARLTSDFYRHGPDYRFGDQILFEDIKRTFGFKTITVGAWVTKEERFIAANLIYDSLADLTQILNVPPEVIGLRKTLSLSFGSGGQKGVQAHYDSNGKILALAKNAGAGALAHEWWHAFDHYICKFLYPKSQYFDFASASWLTEKSFHPHPLNEVLSNFYKHCFLDDNGQQVSQYFKQSISLDKTYNQNYFSRPQEMTARAFEACIGHHNEIKNHYLVSGVKKSNLAKQGGFPSKELREVLEQYIYRYFNALGTALHR
ncbi:CLCA_X family protein [Pseudoalteromonas phenolica]|uniref:CLCA_X family protein n=1 Tax=Pseudoalteromonas phenolica TaxID=161398 RepID=UPI0014864F24|nr:CLCA_X family protein [Pseudoalteromonas phenolica]